MIKRKKYKNALAAIFICFTILIVGTFSIIENGGITDYAVYGAFNKIIPACIVMGILGWLIGKMLEAKPIIPKKDFGYSNSLIEELMREDSGGTPEELDDIDDNPIDFKLTQSISEPQAITNQEIKISNELK